MPVSCLLAVKAVPNASKDSLAGFAGEELKVRVRAPALEGRANDALCEFLAAELGVPSRSVTLARGAKSRHKFIRIEGLGLPEIRRRLEAKPECAV